MSARCQEATYAVQRNAALLDHLVGAGEQHRRDGEAEHAGGTNAAVAVDRGPSFLNERIRDGQALKLLVWGRSPNGRLLVTVWPRYGSALQAGVCKSPRSMGPHGGLVMTRILSNFLLFSCLVMFAWGVVLAAVTLLS
jgi:hypothetical protein